MLSELDLTVGALEVGVYVFSSTFGLSFHLILKCESRFIASVLWGVTTVQLYVYVTKPNTDPLWIKLLVRIVFLVYR